jgi:hypothetical protein
MYYLTDICAFWSFDKGVKKSVLNVDRVTTWLPNRSKFEPGAHLPINVLSVIKKHYSAFQRKWSISPK